MDILADTNVLLRRVHRDDPRHRLTRAAMLRLGKDRHRICVTSQNLIECWAVCTRPLERNGLGLTSGQAGNLLSRIEGAVFRVPDSDVVYREWRRLVEKQGVCGKSSHDAHIVAAMQVNSITHILTFNTDDFRRYPGITVLDPASLAS